MGFKPRGVLGLADSWRVWVVDNLLAGVEAADLIDTLVEHRVSPRVARREVSAIATSPALVACQRYRQRNRQLSLVCALAHQHALQAPEAGAVDRVAGLSPRDFFARYWATNQPVVITDLTAGWPARDWTPESLAARFGDVSIEACVGRTGDPEPDANWRAHAHTMPLAELVRRVRDAGASNDVYLIANNLALDRRALAPLLDDLQPDPELFDLTAYDGGVALWIGPGGTITPLHHDTTNIAFNQLYGRKRVRLIPPWDTRLLDGARGFYARCRMDDLELPDLLIKDVTLEPGETLFIPAGWWHEVEALDVSISFSLLNFRRPNQVDWYRPTLVSD